ncbi:MAG: hypothetical protein GWN84_21595 [Gammaproteobacteria bacterium]|nr:hypothetical protein [Gammaproteobacteria bacterium]NIR85316.1 hypothetical protein [Gammaproteobacteria bacterium]NIR88432.1 hypothetical protein [Gammaproteobacteria bacterium]NIU06382.1 hypothetical protein [Gammaproteobacteria bacterium]NIV53281.1 hypothetical protein [Gammaproteobacteria bacterium]
MMNCRDFDRIMDDLLDGALSPLMAQGARRHAGSCAPCASRLGYARALQEALRMLPVEPASPGFRERVLEAVGAGAHTRRPAARLRPAIATGFAATLALGIALGAFLNRAPPERQAVPQVVLAQADTRPQTVRLLYESSEPMQGVTFTLRVPAHLDLEGFEGRRELTWQADLDAGSNLLRLPVIARRPGTGYLEAQLTHAGRTRTFRVHVRVRDASVSVPSFGEAAALGV